MFLFEDILLLAALLSGVFLIGIPTFKFIKAILPQKKRNPLAEAKERLEQARIEVEAAKLNKEAEKLYDHIYEEALAEQEAEDNETIKQEKR